MVADERGLVALGEVDRERREPAEAGDDETGQVGQHRDQNVVASAPGRLLGLRLSVGPGLSVGLLRGLAGLSWLLPVTRLSVGLLPVGRLAAGGLSVGRLLLSRLRGLLLAVAGLRTAGLSVGLLRGLAGLSRLLPVTRLSVPLLGLLPVGRLPPTGPAAAGLSVGLLRRLSGSSRLLGVLPVTRLGLWPRLLRRLLPLIVVGGRGVGRGLAHALLGSAVDGRVLVLPGPPGCTDDRGGPEAVAVRRNRTTDPRPRQTKRRGQS
ncbi:hypothetical protein GCM10007079_49810 [Nocardiopsis terrae]|nr:hypothetical protein GCM10007079_49810 [Nocardiopsis terrae]